MVASAMFRAVSLSVPLGSTPPLMANIGATRIKSGSLMEAPTSPPLKSTTLIYHEELVDLLRMDDLVYFASKQGHCVA